MSSLETAKTAKKAKVVKFDLRPNEDRKFVNQAYMVVYCFRFFKD